MNYDAIIEQLDAWARELFALQLDLRRLNSGSTVEQTLNRIIGGMHDVAADLHRDADVNPYTERVNPR